LDSGSNQQFSKSLTQTKEHSPQQIQTEAKLIDENAKHFTDSRKENVVNTTESSQNQLQSDSNVHHIQETTSKSSQNPVIIPETQTTQTSQQIQETESHSKIEVKTDNPSSFESSKESPSSLNRNKALNRRSNSEKSFNISFEVLHPSQTQVKHKSELSGRRKHQQKNDDMHKIKTEESDSKTLGTRQHETNGKNLFLFLLKTQLLTVSQKHHLLV
jgi:hypothetical protein